MEASQEGHTKIIKLLLEAGAAANKTKKVMGIQKYEQEKRG